MKKHNYKLLKDWLDKNWKGCTMIMFNCEATEKNIVPWQSDENISKKVDCGFFNQNDFDSFKKNLKL